MAADTASGGLNQLETHYSTFVVSELSLAYFDGLHIPLVDRAGYCGNCWSWTKLDSFAYPFLGNREMGFRAFPREGLLAVSTPPHASASR